MIISTGVENLTSWERKLLYMCNARPTPLKSKSFIF